MRTVNLKDAKVGLASLVSEASTQINPGEQGRGLVQRSPDGTWFPEGQSGGAEVILFPGRATSG